MHSLPQPTDQPRATFLTCVGRIRDPRLRALLISVASDIETAGQEFDLAAQHRSFYDLAQHTTVAGVVTAAQMTAVYNGRMAKKGMAGRRIYDRIKAAPANDRCPLCGQRTVTTLDHYLPKAHYPALAVAPANLVPACGDCNKAKGEALPIRAEDQALHPYYDNIGGDDWLSAVVLEGSPAVVRFFIEPPATADAITTARVKHHFKLFGLASLYTSHAAVELTNIRNYLETLFSATQETGVRAHLIEMARSCAIADRNSWQTATFRALSTDDWYCSGGFR
jgi:hypothetical protein